MFEILQESQKCDRDMKWANVLGKIVLVDLLSAGLLQNLQLKKPLKNWSIIYYPSLSLVVAFVLKSILSDMSIVTPDFLTFPFTWNIFSHPFVFNHVFRPEVSLL